MPRDLGAAIATAAASVQSQGDARARGTKPNAQGTPSTAAAATDTPPLPTREATLARVVSELEALLLACDDEDGDPNLSAALAAVQACEQLGTRLGQRAELTVTIADEAADARKDDTRQHAPPSCRHQVRTKLTMLGIVYIYLPGMIALLCIVLAPLLAAAESWPWGTAAYFLLAQLSGMDKPMGNAADVAPQGHAGCIFALIFSFWMLPAVGLVMNVLLSYHTFPARLTAWAIRLAGTTSMRRQVAVCLLVTLVITPAFLFAFGSIFGLILAAAEGWPALVGIWYVLGNVAAMPNPIVDATPATQVGRMVGVYISVLSFVVASSFIGVAAALPMPSPHALLSSIPMGNSARATATARRQHEVEIVSSSVA